MALGPALSARAVWSKAGTPTLNEVEVLRRLIVHAGMDADAPLHNDYSPTALELSRRNWLPVTNVLAGTTKHLASIDTSAAAFDHVVAPMGNAPDTRKKHWACRHPVLTWAATRDTWAATRGTR